MLGYEVVDGNDPGRTLFSMPEDRTLFFSCRPDVLSMARIQGQQKYIYHFGNRPEEYYDLKKDPLEEHNLISKVGRRELNRSRSEVLAWHAEATAAYPQPGRS